MSSEYKAAKLLVYGVESKSGDSFVPTVFKSAQKNATLLVKSVQWAACVGDVRIIARPLHQLIIAFQGWTWGVGLVNDSKTDSMDTNQKNSPYATKCDHVWPQDRKRGQFCLLLLQKLAVNLHLSSSRRQPKHHIIGLTLSNDGLLGKYVDYTNKEVYRVEV